MKGAEPKAHCTGLDQASLMAYPSQLPLRWEQGDVLASSSPGTGLGIPSLTSISE